MYHRRQKEISEYHYSVHCSNNKYILEDAVHKIRTHGGTSTEDC